MTPRDLDSQSSMSSFRSTTPDTASISNQEGDLNNLERSTANIERRRTRLTDRGARAWLAVVAGFINFFAGFGKLIPPLIDH